MSCVLIDTLANKGKRLPSGLPLHMGPFQLAQILTSGGVISRGQSDFLFYAYSLARRKYVRIGRLYAR